MKRFAFSLMIIAGFAFPTASILALPEDGLVLHFTFDANTVNGDTVKDLSPNGNDGTLIGGATVTNGVLELDGVDGYVGIPALDMRTADKSFTAMCWFKTDEVDNGPLWMWGDNPNPSSSSDAEAPVGWRGTTKKFAAGFYIGGHKYADAEEDYADNQMHFVAQVGDEDTGYLYIDGEQISSAAAGYVYSGNPYFILGARSKNSGSEIDDIPHFKGSIDQVAIYSMALSQEDLRKIAEEAGAVSASGKLATAWGEMKK